jgi:ubiquinone/menaquinone biosynthesis C-methylase UbiE
LTTKAAEKAYLARSHSARWEAAKPFAYSGADTLAHSTDLLHDFAVAMMALRPSPADVIVDLGSGGCWCSDLLTRLNRRAIAVDISLDMLRAGASRSGGLAIPAVAGDLESLPFRGGAFNKAICLSALHHVPDVPRAIGEIARVLTDDGIAVFSEPGQGHATADVAVSAMREYGVLEQDIPFGPFAQRLHDAGFKDVRLKAMAYAVPSIELTPEQWERWSRVASRRRPLRAFTKLWQAAVEIFGLAKNTVLFEQSFERLMVRTLFGAMRDHPVVIASKRSLAPEAAKDWAARITIDTLSQQVVRGGAVRGRINVQNVGRWSWRPTSRVGFGHVAVGIQLLDERESVINRDFRRVPLTEDIYAGDSRSLDLEFPAPLTPGNYRLKIDVVAEGLAWLEDLGSAPAKRSIIVTELQSSAV